MVVPNSHDLRRMLRRQLSEWTGSGATPEHRIGRRPGGVGVVGFGQGGLESAEMLDDGVGNTGGYWDVY